MSVTRNLPPPVEGDAGGGSRAYAADQRAREGAVDPRCNVVLEASAGTGKTRVLVDRYLNLLRYGVDPANILAMTFTRKAAAEMRERILDTLRTQARLSAVDAALWQALRDRSGDIAISTIDAFCLSLLKEFPLEADLDPGFDMADETEVARLTEDALDRALRVSREVARSDEDVRLVFARLGEFRLRAGLASLLGHRLVAQAALGRRLTPGPRDLTAELVCARTAGRLRALFTSLPGGLERFLADGPARHPRYALFVRAVRLACEAGSALESEGSGPAVDAGALRAGLNQIEAHFLTGSGSPRRQLGGYRADQCASKEACRRHVESLVGVAPSVAEALDAFQRDLNVVLSRGVRRIWAIATSEYRRSLEARAVLDFPELLIQALDLLHQMDEFARSRYRLESRYHHLLVDEFQDTSRAQWELVSLLIRSWGEGLGLTADAPLQPSIFIVGDRKQSIYAFRDADVAMLDQAGRSIDRLRPDGGTRRSISRSFRAVPALLTFANDLFESVERVPSRDDAFRYDEADRFPVAAIQEDAPDALGIVAAESVSACAGAVAGEIERLLQGQTVRDRQAQTSRPIRPGDIAILFRSKDSHREFEAALQARNLPAYVYRGLGFFDADEIKDVVALLRYLADPGSSTRAAALLRSRFIRLSDPALHVLAPDLAAALTAPAPPAGIGALDAEDRRVLVHARASVTGWLSLVDCIPPADLLERVLAETAYAYETRGRRALQARENLKKIRAVIRRVQNRGYATLGRMAEHLDRLSAGEEANAVIDAADAVSLMTVHSVKGLEFPVVFLVNLTKGAGGRRPPIRVGDDEERGEPWVSIGEFESDADRDATAREREETKRLLYVALTRARDRLYLASEVRGGRWKPVSGSLGQVLPASFGRLFETASGPAATARVEWRNGDGPAHQFRVCPVPAAAGDESAVRPSPAFSADRHGIETQDDFDGLPDPRAVLRVAVTAAATSVDSPGPAADRDAAASADQVLVGALVHRLFERWSGDIGEGQDLEAVTARVRDLARDDEIVGVDDFDSVARQSALAYVALCSQPDVVSDLTSGERWFEVPFSVRPSGQQAVWRGRFDCVVRQASGRIVVLEFKTGNPAPQHQRQLDAYATAARALFPNAVVQAKLVYAGHAPRDDRPPDA
jgi:ATP-dependent helicase/nuclease subunit A